MSKQLIQKNVFIQKSKDKFNPDVIKKVESEDKNRKVSVFKKTNQTYNSITNQNPDSIKTQKDLELEKAGWTYNEVRQFAKSINKNVK